MGGHKLSDEQQILNQNRIVNLLFSMIEKDEFVLDKNTLCSLHAEVSREEALQWGVFRDGNVNIGGTEYLPPRSNELDTIFQKGVDAVGLIQNPMIRACAYFLFGARSQLF